MWKMPAVLFIGFSSIDFLFFKLNAFVSVFNALGLLVIPCQTFWTLCKNGFPRYANIVLRAVNRMWDECLLLLWALCESN